MAPINILLDLNNQISRFASLGFIRARINSNIILLQEITNDQLQNLNNIEIVIDRVILKENIHQRLIDSIEQCLLFGNGLIKVLVNENKIFEYSEKNRSPSTGKIYPKLQPSLFSFNSPSGACHKCNGLGIRSYFDNNLIILDSSLSIIDGCLKPFKTNSFFIKLIKSYFNSKNIDLSTPIQDMSDDLLNKLFNGSNNEYLFSFQHGNTIYKFTKKFPGIIPWLNDKFYNKSKDGPTKNLEQFMTNETCHECSGQRLNITSRHTYINKKNISDLCDLNIKQLSIFINSLQLTKETNEIALPIIKAISARINYLLDVGLNYLTLNRPANSLSGGENQRIRMATQLGTSLSGIIYILDEPSIGLHPIDTQGLIKTIDRLKKQDNTVIIVEHDEDIIRSSDYIIDLGPGSGTNGGNIIAHSVSKNFLDTDSLTSDFLNGKKSISVKKKLRAKNHFLKLKKAKLNNLKSIDISIPLSNFVCLTGVSGSGKSTLLHNIIVPAVKNYLSKKSIITNNTYQSITGLESIKSIIEMDQTPIGKSPLSNPATYCNFFNDIRQIFSETTESKIRGYTPSRFSFNIKGGRCNECEGQGVKKIEMHFMADIYVSCTECNGLRYNTDTLTILYKTKNIADILNMTVNDAIDFFKNHSKIYRTLSVLNSIGLGYLKLGQPATTLSGGEAQRIKLAREISKKTKGHCIYVLDEPTTGLHFCDIKLLLTALNSLVDNNNTVIVIEHNIDIIKNSDHIIDLGPNGGEEGGFIVAEGTPHEIANNKKSKTGIFLKKKLDAN